MAGRAVYKTADLVYISTSSLFGIRPNQYDNISIPLSVFKPGLKGALKYKHLGETIGTGTSQFSTKTTRSIQKFMRGESAQKVNYIFGEGTSPKLRSIRDGIRQLGFNNSEVLIKHGMKKNLYGITLVSNLKKYLLGMNKKPMYRFPLSHTKKSTQTIVSWWATRWSQKRIRRDKKDLVKAVSKHSLAYPIKHGARVRMPHTNQYKQTSLDFDN